MYVQTTNTDGCWALVGDKAWIAAAATATATPATQRRHGNDAETTWHDENHHNTRTQNTPGQKYKPPSHPGRAPSVRSGVGDAAARRFRKGSQMRAIKERAHGKPTASAPSKTPHPAVVGPRLRRPAQHCTARQRHVCAMYVCMYVQYDTVRYGTVRCGAAHTGMYVLYVYVQYGMYNNKPTTVLAVRVLCYAAARIHSSGRHLLLRRMIFGGSNWACIFAPASRLLSPSRWCRPTPSSSYVPSTQA